MFGGGQCGSDRLRGLVANGPFRPITLDHPRFGFVFPSENRDDANRLFQALKNGIGYFRGVENTFRFPLRTDQVFAIPVAGVHVSPVADHSKNAHAYAKAILAWHSEQPKQKADMFFVLHPKTGQSVVGTEYYECKAQLLQEGILSQNVTLDLLRNRSQFEWSAANIALGAFVKLGGIPWVVPGEALDQDLILGVGRAYVYDPTSRKNTAFMAFTACFSARGPLKFVSLARAAGTKEEYLDALQDLVKISLAKADQLGTNPSSLTVHAPKEMKKEELATIRNVVNSYEKKNILEIGILKITDESLYFALDDQFPDGIPRRGTAVRVTDREFMLYTEGREETESWRARLPVALRIAPSGNSPTDAKMLAMLRQINDLSQVNWRGFNARSKPISIYYSSLIAQLLSHVPHGAVSGLHKPEALPIIQERMWFL